MTFISPSACLCAICRPKSVQQGGQKRHWNDIVLKDLKCCDLFPDWHKDTYEQGAWQGLVCEALLKLNFSREKEESIRKEQLK